MSNEEDSRQDLDDMTVLQDVKTEDLNAEEHKLAKDDNIDNLNDLANIVGPSRIINTESNSPHQQIINDVDTFLEKYKSGGVSDEEITNFINSTDFEKVREAINIINEEDYQYDLIDIEDETNTTEIAEEESINDGTETIQIEEEEEDELQQVEQEDRQSSHFNEEVDRESDQEEGEEESQENNEESKPVTEPPVTEPPVTEPPVTEPPVTEPPVTEPPVTEPPVTEPPVTEPPVTEPPVTEPPVTEPPETEPPVTEPPETEPPVTEPPETEPPVTEPPETEPPVTEPPVTEPPVTEPPETEPPVTEPPETEPPVTDPPFEENILELSIGKGGKGNTGEFEVFINEESMGVYTTDVAHNSTGEWDSIKIDLSELELGETFNLNIEPTKPQSHIIINNVSYEGTTYEAEELGFTEEKQKNVTHDDRVKINPKADLEFNIENQDDLFTFNDESGQGDDWIDQTTNNNVEETNWMEPDLEEPLSNIDFGEADDVNVIDNDTLDIPDIDPNAF